MRQFFPLPPIAAALSLLGATAITIASCTASAQALSPTPLEQGAPVPAPLPGKSSAGTKPPASKVQNIAPGGAQVVINSVSVTGNTSFSSEALLAAAGFTAGSRYDLSGMHALAEKVADFYHAKGYPFASAFLPEQQVSGGTLTIEVIEGRYGRVYSSGEFLPEDADPFLANLRSGEPIRAALLERTMLIIDDLPAIDVTPNVKPGAAYGTGDLGAHITRQERYSGDVGLDNLGNRFTGEYRLRGSFNAFSLLRFGDEIRLRALKSDADMFLGSADYEAPLNGQGWRGQIGFARTSYQLGREYATLDAKGFADVLSARVGYPVVRTQARNLSISGSIVYKNLHDEIGAYNSVTNKHSIATPLTAVFDVRDSFIGGGLTYGNIVWTPGRLSLDDTALANDVGGTQGRFQKLNGELSRLQTLPMNFSLFTRFAAQWADKNLDASEKFSLGGIYGVRAYPLGQGVGDKGWLLQTELRQRWKSLTGFLLFDAGHSTANVNPWDTSSSTTESVQGAGLGVRREQLKGWNFEVLVASRLTQKKPSDNSNNGPRMLASATYRY